MHEQLLIDTSPFVNMKLFFHLGQQNKLTGAPSEHEHIQPSKPQWRKLEAAADKTLRFIDCGQLI